MSDITFNEAPRAAVLDAPHIGGIQGALGTIRLGDNGRRAGWKAKLSTLMAIVGPGLIVMVGDNDAGAFGTYTQAGQNYGTALLWTLLLLVPVLYVNQEMVVRLGAVTGVGHARLILERFGKFWGAFSVIDLFILNGLTIVTEFIGINLALGFLGVPRIWGIIVAAGIIISAASTGSFRRFERFSLALCFFRLLLVPVFMMVHPPLAEIGRDFLVPRFPTGSKLSDVMLLVIAIVGTTVAPWQLFFQQSYVIDKRITVLGNARPHRSTGWALKFRHIIAKSLFFANWGSFRSGDYEEVTLPPSASALQAGGNAMRPVARQRDHRRETCGPLCQRSFGYGKSVYRR